jgi:DNA-directed RNA polymerase subunit RPC12/RpoP
MFFVLYSMDYQLLRAYDNYISASIILARLDEEGIQCYLKDEYTVTIDPILTNAVGGIKLMVEPTDFERAKELLDGFDQQFRASATCPKCGSHDIVYISKPGIKNWFTAIASWLFSSYAIPATQVYQCAVCGNETADLPVSDEEPIIA